MPIIRIGAIALYFWLHADVLPGSPAPTRMYAPENATQSHSKSFLKPAGKPIKWRKWKSRPQETWEDILDRPFVKTPWGEVPKGLTKAQLQNFIANRENLPVYRTRKDIEDDAALGRLLGLEKNGIVVGDIADTWRKACSAQCTALLQDLTLAYGSTRLKGEIVVNSAVRDPQTQLAIRAGNKAERIPPNYNAAPIDGPSASSHFRGSTADICKLKMPGRGIRQIGQWLEWLEKSGYIVYVSEYGQAVYHVFVTPQYTAGTLQKLIADEAAKKKPPKKKPARKLPRRGNSQG